MALSGQLWPLRKPGSRMPKRPVVRLLEAGTLDHTDAKNVENLPEYAVYVLSTAGITYITCCATYRAVPRIAPGSDD